MVNFLQHKNKIIREFCDVYKKQTTKELWGITLNCNTKSPDEVWLNRSLLIYQQLSESSCASGCTFENPSFLITQYATSTGTSPFPAPYCFDPYKMYSTSTASEYTVCPGCCYTGVTVTNSSSVKTYNFTVAASGSNIPLAGSNIPLAGSTTFTYAPLIGRNIQLSLGGYGFFNPGPTGTIQYTFDSSTGKITLQGGLLFNLGETYTIFAYT